MKIPHKPLSSCVLTYFFIIFSGLAVLPLKAALNTSPDVSVLMPSGTPSAAHVVPFWASINEAAPSITLNFYRDGDFEIYRRVYGETDWGSSVATIAPGTFTWEDSNVQVGVVYEYAVDDLNYQYEPSDPLRFYRDSKHNRVQYEKGFGYIVAGIRADRVQDRGTVILAIADTAIEGNEVKLHRLVEDLVGDGWKVRMLHTPSFYDKAWGFDTNHSTAGFYGYEAQRRLRQQIQAIYAENPGEVTMLYCLGHVPLALTGTRVEHTDGHGRRSGYATDFIYADIDGVYSDTESNTGGSIDGNMHTSRDLANMPWDGIYDQSNMASRLELAVGRVDPFNVSGATDAEHIATYLDKVHSYRHLKPYGLAGSEAVISHKGGFRWQPGGRPDSSATAFQLFSIFGPGKMEDYIYASALPAPVAPNTDPDVEYLADPSTEPYLIYAQSKQKPPAVDFGSKAAHRMSMQSHWSDWWDHVNNQAVKDIFRDTNMTLSWLYTGRYNTQHFNFILGMGEPYGEMVKLSANHEWDEYFRGVEPNPSVVQREFIHPYIGDPTLRLFPVEPISNLVAAPVSNTVQLSWTAPTDLSQFEEYRVYRSNDLMGDFSMIASGLTSPTFTDNSPLPGSSVYMVKAVHLVENGSGSFLNNAQGIFANVGMQIDTTVLPALPLGEDVNFNFAVSGAAGAASWSLVSGYVPLGTQLLSDGTLQGNPISPGHYEFELEVSDGVSTLRRAYAILVDSARSVIADIDLREHNGGGLLDKSYHLRDLTVHGDPQWDPEGGMIFNGIDDAIQVHDLAPSIYSDFDMMPKASGFALVAAFKADASSSGGTILAKALDYAAYPNNHSQYAVRMAASGKIEYRLRHSKRASPLAYNDGQWHTVAFVHEHGQYPQLYIDAVYIGSLTTGHTNLVTEDLLIGARWNGDMASGVTDVFDGSIADVKIYKTGITAGEMLALHQRRTQSRGDVTPAAPVIHGVPVSIGAYENAPFSFDFSVTDANGEPVRPIVVPSDKTQLSASDLKATATGYRYEGVMKSGSAGNTLTFEVLVDDGWPGMVASSAPIDTVVTGVVDDAVSMSVDGGLIDVLANDVALPGESFTLHAITSQRSDVNVGVTIEGSQVRITPDLNWGNWPDPFWFDYQVMTLSGVLLEARVRVTPNDAPTLNYDGNIYVTHKVQYLDLLANDIIPDGVTATLIDASVPSRHQDKGYVRVHNGKALFVALEGWQGSSIGGDYTVETRPGRTFNGSFEIDGISGLPVLQDDQHTVIDSSATMVDVLANDDGQGQQLTLFRVEGLQWGSARIVNNQLEYTPPQDVTSFNERIEYFVRNEGGFVRSAFLNISTPSADAPLAKAAYDFDEGSGASLANSGEWSDAAQVHGAVSWEARDGGQALIFDGSSTYVDLGNPSAMSIDPSTDSFSIAMAFKIEDPARYQTQSHMLLSKESGIGTNDQFAIELSPYATYFTEFKLHHPDYSSSNDQWYPNPYGWTTWKHLVVTFDANTRELIWYLDNERVAAEILSSVTSTPDNGLSWILGARRDGSGGYADHFAGSIDQFRFYDRVISPLEVKALLEAMKMPNTDMLAYLTGEVYPSDGAKLERGKTYTFVVPLQDVDTLALEFAYFIYDSTNTLVASGSSYRSFNFTPSITGSHKMDLEIMGNWTELNYTVTASEQNVGVPPFVLSGNNQWSARSGAAISEFVQTAGGVAPLSYSATNLPSGLSIDAGTGEISGAVSATGKHFFTVDVSDHSGATDSQTYSLDILPADTDADGIDDDWETLYIGHLNDDGSGDSDGDGRAALIEYALGSRPDQQDAALPIRLKSTYGPPVSGNDRYMEVEFDRKSKLASSISVKLQVSSDMQTWTDVNVSPTLVSDDGDMQTLRMRTPMGSDSIQFFRIQAQQP